MQSTLCFSPSILPTNVSSPKATASPWISVPGPRLQTSLRLTVIRSTALPIDNSSVDYSSPTSVFPAEACETIGGDACGADVYPEVKLDSVVTAKTTTTSESVDREYLEYDNPKTVFPAEACDDLGGEFCDPEYQSGVFK